MHQHQYFSLLPHTLPCSLLDNPKADQWLGGEQKLLVSVSVTAIEVSLTEKAQQRAKS